MKRRALILLRAAASAGVATQAGAERLVTSLSSHQVLVTSSFTGVELVLFGSVERDAATVPRRGGYDILVTVTGPRETVVARRKDRIFGIWANAASETFPGAPVYLAVLSNRPLNEIASPQTRERLGIGLEQMLIPKDADSAGRRPDEFREALVRLRKARRLYIDEPNNITFLTPNLFRASIRLPAEAPVGVYEIDVKLFADGANLARATSAMEVVKVGIEQFVASAAHEYSFLYGLGITLMALATGWFASVVFRRD
jgi:uncharacterized protein (TIGR02186 family)